MIDLDKIPAEPFEEYELTNAELEELDEIAENAELGEVMSIKVSKSFEDDLFKSAAQHESNQKLRMDLERVPAEWRDHYTRYQSMTAERGCEAIEEIARLTEQLEEKERELSGEEQEHERTIVQRDAAEESLSLAYLTVTRNEAIWSNLFGYDEAVNDIAAELQRLCTEVGRLRGDLFELRYVVTAENFAEMQQAAEKAEAENAALTEQLTAIKNGKGWYEDTPAGQRKHYWCNETEELKQAGAEIAALTEKLAEATSERLLNELYIELQRLRTENAALKLHTHKWTGRQLGGNPANAESYEWVRFCDYCGMEDTCEEDMPPCEVTRESLAAENAEKDRQLQWLPVDQSRICSGCGATYPESHTQDCPEAQQ